MRTKKTTVTTGRETFTFYESDFPKWTQDLERFQVPQSSNTVHTEYQVFNVNCYITYAWVFMFVLLPKFITKQTAVKGFNILNGMIEFILALARRLAWHAVASEQGINFQVTYLISLFWHQP